MRSECSMLNKKRLIVVLGMHRSGTSTITRALQVFGIDLGDRLFPPLAPNPKGYWEDGDILGLNIEMLNFLHYKWQQVTQIHDTDVLRLEKQGYLLRAVELLRSKLEDKTIFSFKDPRVTQLLPFWKQVFMLGGWDVSYIIAIRNPLSIVKSLQKRDNFDTRYSYLLWLSYIVTALQHTVNEKRILVEYDRLLNDTESALRHISVFIALPIDEREYYTFINDFIDKSLRHSIHASSDLLIDATCPTLVREVYDMLLECSLLDHEVLNRKLNEYNKQWNDSLNILLIPFAVIDGMYERICLLNKDLEACSAINDKHLLEICNLNDFKKESENIIRHNEHLLLLQKNCVTEKEMAILKQGQVILELKLELSNNNCFVNNLLKVIRRILPDTLKKYLK